MYGLNSNLNLLDFPQVRFLIKKDGPQAFACLYSIFAECQRNGKPFVMSEYGRDVTASDLNITYDDFIRLYSWQEKNKLTQNGAPNDDFFLVGLLSNITHYVRVSEVAKLPETKKQTIRNFARKLRNETLNK